MFSKKGVIIVAAKSAAGEDKITEIVLEAGADDLNDDGDYWEILTSPKDFEAVRDAVKGAKLETESAEVTMVPQRIKALCNSGVRNDAVAGDSRRTGRHANVYSNFERRYQRRFRLDHLPTAEQS